MLGLEKSSSGVVCMFMLGLGKESGKNSRVDVVVKLEVDVRDREGSVYLAFSSGYWAPEYWAQMVVLLCHVGEEM